MKMNRCKFSGSNTINADGKGPESKTLFMLVTDEKALWLSVERNDPMEHFQRAIL
ncbi:hypothetical protein ACUXHY_002521 [Cytobacillus horneckiae]|uniref:hypothetical protein n=1 Tax=Cytobacillus horneckiae TaxID=549687 RepID=UPI0019D0C6F3|nr:hypothetical protein [Cytobacillus horneckiae]